MLQNRLSIVVAVFLALGGLSSCALLDADVDNPEENLPDDDGSDDNQGDGDQTDANNDNDDSQNDDSQNDDSQNDDSQNDDSQNDDSQNDNEPVVRAGWKLQSSPFDGHGVYAVEFIDESTGYAATTGEEPSTGGFWKTTDGGDSWSSLRGQLEAREITRARQGSRLWGFQIPAGSEFGIWYSDNDGDDWMPRELDVSETIENAVFFDDQTGLAASNTARRLHRTTNGGESWTKIEPENDYVECGISDINAAGDHVWIGGSTSADSAKKGGCVAWSTDRGQSWNLHKLTNEAHSFQGAVIEGVWVKSQDEIWAVGQQRQIFWTEDGGDSWNQVEEIPESISSFTDVSGNGDFIVATALSDGGSGADFGQGGLTYHSYDGGQSWEIGWSREKAPPIFNGVTIVSDQLGWAWGDDGPIMKYSGEDK